MSGIQVISCIRFSIQLFIGESIFTVGWKRKKWFGCRLIAGIAGYFAAALTVFKICTSIPGSNPVVYIVYYICMFLFSLGAMKFCFSVKLEELLFAGGCGYATQHIAYAMITIILELSGISLTGIWDLLLVRLLPYLLVSGVIYFGVVRKNTGKGELKQRDMGMVLLSLAILFTVIIISVLVDDKAFRQNHSLLQNVFCKIYAIICSVLAIFIAYYLSRQNRILRENEMMENMLHTMGEQQKLSRETIGIINIKCHDLKYRISKISGIEDGEERQEYINSVREALEIYDNIFQTGNDALDLVLTEKSLLCKEYNIKFSSMVDGGVLAFLSSTDVYVLFGNLMDNAIESVMKEPDEEKRIISMRVSRRNNGSHIHIENYCNEQVIFLEGLPLTTKEDTAYHGFGVRSIKYIVEKCSGNVLMRREKDRFLVDILFYPEKQ